MSTRQEMFDKMADHLLTQMEAATDNHGRCFYRYTSPYSGKELKCAVGCLIDDAEYDFAMEGSIHKLAEYKREKANEGIEVLGWLDAVNIDKLIDPFIFLYDMQNVHDTLEPKDWKEYLGAIAEKYKLSDAVLNKY